MTNAINADTKPIAQATDDMNISYSLYDTGAGEAAYLMRDEDANEMITRVNGSIEIITLRYELDIAKIN